MPAHVHQPASFRQPPNSPVEGFTKPPHASGQMDMPHPGSCCSEAGSMVSPTDCELPVVIDTEVLPK